MKKLITKFWGIGLIVVLLSTMFVAGVTPASAATLAWSNQTIPSVLTNQLVTAAVDAALVKVAANGDVFAVDPATRVVYKSTTGGVTWAPSAPVGAAADVIVDLAVSPGYATDGYVFVLVAGPPAQVYISTSGGAAFAVLGGSIAGRTGTSLDVAPNYLAGVGEVMVGTVDAAAGVGGTAYGDIYIWGRLGVQNWVAQAIGADTVGVTGVVYAAAGATYAVSYLNQNLVVRTGATAATVTITGLAAATFTLAGAAATDTVYDVTAIALLAGPEAGADTFILTGATYNNRFAQYTAVGVFADGNVGGQDVTSVAFSPKYPIDATIVAVGSVAVLNGATALNFKVSTLPWNVTGGLIRTAVSAIIGDWNAGGGANILASDIAFPSDFIASSTLLRTLFVSVRSAWALGLDNVYRVFAGAGATPLNPPATNAALTDREYTSIVYNGDSATGTLYAGVYADIAADVAQVFRCSTTTSIVPLWFGSTNPPTGTALAAAPTEMTYLALANDFATSNRIYAGTRGSFSALSVSNDGGANFYQAGLIETGIAGGGFSNIQDLRAVSATELWMVTQDVTAGYPERVWKSVDTGATWYSVLALATPNDTAIVRPSPNYATDATVYFAATGALATAIRLTSNGGTSWDPRISPIAVADIAVKDQYTFYIANQAAGTVIPSASGGWTWLAPGIASVAAACNQIKVDLATGHLLVGLANGSVAISTNNNFTYTPLAGGVPIAASPAIVAFDTNYATNNVIYAASATPGVGVTGIRRYWVGTSVNWGVFAIDVANLNLRPRDIFVAPDGVLYASDVTPATAFGAPVPAGGVIRILDPSNPFGPTVVERLTGDDGLTAADVLSGLAIAQGSNVMWAINNLAAPAIRTFTDTLSVGAPTLATPAEGALIDAVLNPVTFTFTGVTGGLNYQIRYDTRPDFLTATVVAVAWPSTFAIVVPGNINDGFTYYWQARVATPVIGPWSASGTFQTQNAPALINSPAILGAVEGGTNVGGWNASLTPTFQWGAIANATGYEFQLASDVDMTVFIVDLSGASALGNVTSYKLAGKTLKYSTTYYWKVKAIAPNLTTDWSPVVAFTTLAEPAKAAPPVEIKQLPAPIITVETPPPPPDIVIEAPEPAKEIAPGYIWAIIIIGAVLVIAVIVLIVKTRRSV